MAGTWGHGLQGFASGFSTGRSMKMERAKIDALKKEQERLKKEKEEADKIFQDWYNSQDTKDFLMNLDTASQGERAYFTTGLIRMSKEVFDYFTEIDNDIREGNIKEAQDKNDLVEAKLKAATDLAQLGMTAVFPDGSPMKISEEDIEFQKKIQIGKVAGGKTGEAIGGQIWKSRGYGELPAETKELSAADKKFNWAWESYQKWLINPNDPKGINFEEFKKYAGITPEKATGLEKEIQDIITQGKTAGIPQEQIGTAIKNKILGKPVVTTKPTFKSLQDIKDSFKNVKTRAEYDEALASYESSKEAKTSGWTPPPFDNQLTDLIKKVEEAFWADFVNKDGKLKDKGEAELYNTKLQHYLKLIEEARNAGIDVSQFQAFIPYKELYWGRGNPLVTAESW